MKTIDEMREIKEYYVNVLYPQVRKAQKADQTYYDDTFVVPEVKSPHHIYRSGLGVRIIDAPAEQIVTSNPQVFVEVGNKDIEKKIGKVFNDGWLDLLRRQNPNPFKESIKNPLLRGEGFIRLIAKPGWKQGDRLPVNFIIPDPMVIYASPEEDEDGIPKNVVVFYERQILNVLSAYPGWTNPLHKDLKSGVMVDWWEFWDGDTRYTEADDEAILGEAKPNPYGFTPFIRRYSGFGRRTPDGELASLIVSDIRRSRDLLLEECAMRSNIASIQYLFAHKERTFVTSGEVDDAAFREEYRTGAYSINVIQGVPVDFKQLEDGDRAQISDATLQHHRDIISELNQRHPFIMAGFPLGSSGRQQDMTQVAAMRRYDSVLENAETMWATAFEKAWVICRKLGMTPIGVGKKELEVDFKGTVKLRAKDPVEADRMATLGNRNMEQGVIDLRTNLIQYHGYDPNEAEEIIENILVDNVTFRSPEVAELMGIKLAEKAGMAEEMELLKQRKQKTAQQQSGLLDAPPPSTQQRRTGETATPLGREMIDDALRNRGQRNPPTAFSRGG